MLPVPLHVDEGGSGVVTVQFVSIEEQKPYMGLTDKVSIARCVRRWYNFMQRIFDIAHNEVDT